TGRDGPVRSELTGRRPRPWRVPMTSVPLLDGPKRSRATAAAVLAVVLSTPALPTSAHADEPLNRSSPPVPAPRLPRDNLLVYRGPDGKPMPVQSTSDWLKRRAEIVAGMQSVMGTLPGPEKRCPLDVRVEEEVDGGSYVR